MAGPAGAVWKCPDCGFENSSDESECTGGCGHFYIPAVLMLSCSATGKFLRLRVAITIGKDLLRTVLDDESRFASDQQYTISKSREKRAWVVRHVPAATNPTFLNGKTLPDLDTPLAVADILSIGPTKASVTIKFEN